MSGGAHQRFDLAASRRGMRLNRLGHRLREPALRARFGADPDAVLAEAGLTAEERAALVARDWKALLVLGASVYALAKIGGAMGIYAPTLGIVGAVLGLMAVMANLAEPSKLGAGIAAAFTATIYGIASANLFFLPFGNKLKYHVKEQAKMRTMMIEGLVLIAQGDNPRNIETRLQGYFVAHPKPEAKAKSKE